MCEIISSFAIIFQNLFRLFVLLVVPTTIMQPVIEALARDLDLFMSYTLSFEDKRWPSFSSVGFASRNGELALPVPHCLSCGTSSPKRSPVLVPQLVLSCYCVMAASSVSQHSG